MMAVVPPTRRAASHRLGGQDFTGERAAAPGSTWCLSLPECGISRSPTEGDVSPAEHRGSVPVCPTTGIKLRGPEGAQRLRATSASMSELGGPGTARVHRMAAVVLTAASALAFAAVRTNARARPAEQHRPGSPPGLRCAERRSHSSQRHDPRQPPQPRLRRYTP
jgi:hypothetical protein